MNLFEKFVGLYSLSKTIPFELRPVIIKENKTEEERTQVLKEFWEKFKLSASYKDDEQRAKSYPIVKALMDQFHKRIIEESLSVYSYNGWESLAEAYKKNKRSDGYKTLQKKARESVSSSFSQHKKHVYVNDIPNFLKKQLKEEIYDEKFLEDFRLSNKTLFTDNNLSSEENNIDSFSNDEYRKELSTHIDAFSKFPGSYFAKYKKNRENIYSSKAQTTSVSNRLVNENFVTFVENVEVYNRLVKHCPEELQTIEVGLSSKLNGMTLAEIFSYEFYNKCLTQQGIDFYNYLIGGDTSVQANVFGLNDVGNKFLQKHPESHLRLKDLKMAKLYKQILSDRELPKFLRKKFASTEEMKEAVSCFITSMQNGGISDVLNVLGNLKDNGINTQQIYVTGKWIATLSQYVFGSWNILPYQLRDSRISANPKKEKGALDKEIAEWVEKKIFSLDEIRNAAENIEKDKVFSIYKLFTSLIALKKEYIKDENDEVVLRWKDNDLWQECQDSIKELNNSKEEEYNDNLKVVLDQFLHIFHVVSILRLGNKEDSVNKDSFYILYNQLFTHDDNMDTIKLCDIVPLYDAVRDFINTNRLNDKGKTKLNFDSATLTKGWKNSFIIQYANKYYLGVKVYNHDIYNQTKDTNYEKLKITKNEEKLLYSIGDCCIIENRLLKMEMRNLVRMFIYSSKKTNPYRICSSVKKYSLPLYNIKENFDIYDSLKSNEQEEFLKNNQDFLIELIDYFKLGITKHPSLKPYVNLIQRNWKSSDKYASPEEFAKDIEQFGYFIEKQEANFDCLYSLYKSGKIILFQIYNKDFSEHVSSLSSKNLHTLYWEEMFSERNLQNIVFKLSNEGAEIFFRNQKVENAFVHKKGSWLVNKRFKDGEPIPEKLYNEYNNPNNIDEYGEYKISQLSPEAIKHIDKISKKIAKHDIKKDKRYHEDKCKLHVPIEINFGKRKVNPDRLKSENAKFNDYTLGVLRDNRDDLKIIGIDRGERNLIYVTMINQRGEIEFSKSFNIVDNVGSDGTNRPFDYHQKLDQIEGDRAEARKNWKKQKKIKDTKKGFLGFVVHEVSKLVVNNNAIIVLEDLNYGFKRGRFGIEKQVYQEFEKELISKLNYLALKSGSPSKAYANIHNGLQLTAPFSSFKDLGRQTGWLFYVPASYTSKIDPITGFVNLFNIKKAEKNPRDFFMSFNRIEYKNDAFVFEFDYSKEDTYTVAYDYKNVWTITSNGGRLVYNTQTKKTELVKDLTKEIRTKVFDKYNIDIFSLSVNRLSQIEDERFFKKLLRYFKLILQMRNSNEREDYIISPVEADQPFDTRKEAEKGQTADRTWVSKFPADADANGAYHIALKGLYLVLNNFPMEHNKESDGEHLKYLTTKEWLEFVQKHDYRND